MQRLRKSCFTAGLSSKPDCPTQKQQNCSQVLLLNCKQNLIKSFSKTFTSSSLTTGDVTAKPARNGKSTCAIPTTFSFTRKSAGKNSPNKNSARNADSLSQLKPDRPAERRVLYCVCLLGKLGTTRTCLCKNGGLE